MFQRHNLAKWCLRSRVGRGKPAGAVLCWTVSVNSSASDEELLARQCALQDEARDVLAELDLAALVANIGPLPVTGQPCF